MKTYIVTYTETRQAELKVKANSFEEARKWFEDNRPENEFDTCIIDSIWDVETGEERYE